MAKSNKGQQPEQPSTPRAAGGLPKLARARDAAAKEKQLAPNAPFWLVFVPGRYCVMEEHVVPLLHEYKLQTGVNGVLELEDGTLVVDGAEENLRVKGATAIPWDLDEEPYLREIAPKHWTTRWTTPRAGTAHVKVDSKGYTEWLRSLVDRGLVPAPTIEDLDRLASALRFDIEKSSENPAIQPYRVKQLRAQLEVVEREIEAAGGPPADAPAAGSGELPKVARGKKSPAEPPAPPPPPEPPPAGGAS